MFLGQEQKGGPRNRTFGARLCQKTRAARARAPRRYCARLLDALGLGNKKFLRARGAPGAAGAPSGGTFGVQVVFRKRACAAEPPQEPPKRPRGPPRGPPKSCVRASPRRVRASPRVGKGVHRILGAALGPKGTQRGPVGHLQGPQRGTVEAQSGPKGPRGAP